MHNPIAPKFMAYLELIRPFTLVAPIVGGLAGALMGWTHDHGTLQGIGWHQWIMIFNACFSLAMVNAASNTLNNIYDIKIDRINKPTRPLPSGRVTRDEAFTLSWALYMVALFRATWIGEQFGTLVLIIMFITVLYSFPPVRFKKRLWLNNISIATARGVLGFVAAWSILSDVTASPDPWAMGLVISVFLVGSTTSKDFTDVKGDRQFGMRTLPVVYGNRKAIMMSAPFLIGAFLLIPIAVWLGWLITWSLALMTLLPWSVYIVYLMMSGPKEDGKMENSSVWRQMYFALMALQAGFATVYIVHAIL